MDEKKRTRLPRRSSSALATAKFLHHSIHFGAVAVSEEYAFAPVDDEANEAKPSQWSESKPIKLMDRNGQNGDPGITNLNP